MLRKALLVCLLGSGGQAWAQNAELDRAQSLFDELKYPAAAKALEAAAAQPGNNRATVIRILEMRGICDGALNHSAKAVTAFKALLELEPDHALTGDWPPRVTTPYLEAKAWASDHGALQFEVGADAVRVTVTKDPLQLAQSVRFHFRPAKGEWKSREVALTGGAASIDAPEDVDWWAELLGERQGVIGSAGSESSPRSTHVRVAAAEPKPPAPAPAPLPEPQTHSAPTEAVQAPVESNGPTLRPLAYGLAVAGLGSLGAGTFFGVRSHQAQTTLANVTTDTQGRVTSITQRAAFALDSQRKNDALLANVLLSAGGGLVLVGAGVFWVGGQAEVSLGPSGAVVRVAIR
jgi:hypothetical protein